MVLESRTHLTLSYTRLLTPYFPLECSGHCLFDKYFTLNMFHCKPT